MQESFQQGSVHEITSKTFYETFKNYSPNHRYGTCMTLLLENPYFIIFQCFKYHTTLIVKELLYINKIKFCTRMSKSVVTYITLTVLNISNNRKKQY